MRTVDFYLFCSYDVSSRVVQALEIGVSGILLSNSRNI